MYIGGTPAHNDNETGTQLECAQTRKSALQKLETNNGGGPVCGHAILNPFGEEIRVTAAELQYLDYHNLLRRDRLSGLQQFKPEFSGLYNQLEIDHQLGDKFDGPMAVFCRCRECRPPIKCEADYQEESPREFRRRKRLLARQGRPTTKAWHAPEVSAVCSMPQAP